MRMPEIGGEPKQTKIILPGGDAMVCDAIVTNVSVESVHRGRMSEPASIPDLIDYGEMIVTLRPTGPIEWDTVSTPAEDDIGVFAAPMIRPLDWVRPFTYGLAFLVLLWACIAWEKWIGWMMR